MAMTLMLIGSVGVMAMQRAAIQGNADARELDVASSIARTWIERLERDATLWTPSQIAVTPPANIGNATLVNESTLNGVWYVPQARYAASGSQGDVESAAFDILGQDVDPASAGARYCVNARLTPLTTDQTLIRAEVRVYWPRNLTQAPDANYCAAVPQGIDAAVQKYHFVYAATAVRQNVSP